jgi:hypothetical protein
LTFLSPELLKEVFSPDKVNKYPKLQFIFGNFKRVLGEGMAFSEGAAWKNKRKVISSVFNF